MKGFTASGSARAAITAEIDHIAILAFRGKRCGKDHILSVGSLKQDRFTQCPIGFLVRVPVLSEHRISTPAISSMEDNRDTMAFSLDKASAPSAMVIEKTAGMATGMDATRRIRTNLQDIERIGKPPIVRQ